MRKFLLLVLIAAHAISHAQPLTIEHCVKVAQENYPAIKKAGLLEKTLDLDLSDINRGWLPRISVYGQGTVQNVVPSFPSALSGVLEQMGQEIDGLGKWQYKIGVDVSQAIWDGGTSKAQRQMSRAKEAVQQSSVDVELYAVRQKVESLFFAILLTEEQIAQNRQTLSLLGKNLDKINVMLRNGTAMQSDADMMEAQMLTLKQGITQAESAVKGYRQLLSLYTGENTSDKALSMPTATLPNSQVSARPELQLFDTQMESARAALRLSDTSTMPKVGLFAQAYYGYPGFDYFKSIISRDMSFNILAGIKMSWNIDAFYTKRNTSDKTALNLAQIKADRETFLFNSQLQSESQTAAIEGLRKVMTDDTRIVELRSNVRKAAESQLNNGIIDMTTLLSKITDENLAQLTAKFHEIQYLQEIYKLKYTLNQ